jgi:LemA protein
MGVLLVVIIVVAVLLTVFVSIYNSLVKLRNTSEQAWSDIDVQLKRRYSLVPNLIETVKGYASHEKLTFERVVEARGKAMQSSSPAEKSRAENVFESTLKTLFALAENYPQLKANENFLELQTELSKIEEQIQLARRYYNAVVRDLNNKIESIPSNIVANLFGFKRKEYFELPVAEQREAPRVSF